MSNRRGRPSKFGRPAQAVVMTLPLNVLEWLRGRNPDPARAVVDLFEATCPTQRERSRAAVPSAELVQLPGRRALIVVDPRVVTGLEGVALIPLADGRAFLALEPGMGAADLEVAVIDRLDAMSADAPGYVDLEAFRTQLREWRTSGELRFHLRSIIVAERRPQGMHVRPLSALGALEASSSEVPTVSDPDASAPSRHSRPAPRRGRAKVARDVDPIHP